MKLVFDHIQVDWQGSSPRSKPSPSVAKCLTVGPVDMQRSVGQPTLAFDCCECSKGKMEKQNAEDDDDVYEKCCNYRLSR